MARTIGEIASSFLLAMTTPKHQQPSTKQAMTTNQHTFQLPDPFPLESGAVLAGAQVAYRTWGRLNAARDNAVWV